MSVPTAPSWLTEPVRKVANRVAGLAVALGVVLVAVNQSVDFVPAQYRDRVSAVLAAVTAGAAAVVKIAGEITRNKVFSPATHDAEVKVAKAAALRKP